MTKENLEGKVGNIKIDPDISPNNQQNINAARKLRLTYDFRIKVYRNNEGYVIADQFGQRY